MRKTNLCQKVGVDTVAHVDGAGASPVTKRMNSKTFSNNPLTKRFLFQKNSVHDENLGNQK
jgi:hypothetical protein